MNGYWGPFKQAPNLLILLTDQQRTAQHLPAGWVQQNLLSGKRGALVIDEARTLRTDPTGGAKAVAILQPGVVAEIAECGTDNWCRMEVKGYKGWLRRDDFWGTYPDEVFDAD